MLPELWIRFRNYLGVLNFHRTQHRKSGERHGHAVVAVSGKARRRGKIGLFFQAVKDFLRPFF